MRKGVSFMSAFLVSMRSINQMVAVISSLLRFNRHLWIAKRFAAVGFATTQANWQERLAQAMFRLNQEALYQRYGDPATERFLYEPVDDLPDLCQTLKSVQCWLYQCTEGDVPDRKLYRFFDTVVRVWLLDIIVSRLPEYAEAEWE